MSEFVQAGVLMGTEEVFAYLAVMMAKSEEYWS